jgi:ATP synthase protein I
LDNSEELPKPLTRAELEVILGSEALEPSIISVKRLFALQAFVTMLSCFAWGWSVKGKPFGLDSSAISALLGGLIAIIPAGLFAIRARLLTKKVIESGVARLAVAGLVTGEIIKIIATVAMFFLVIVFYPDLDWLPLLLTYVLALKCYWLAWILRK